MEAWETLRPGLDHGSRGVPRAVVDNDHFPGAVVGLAAERFELKPDRLLAVKRGDHHGDQAKVRTLTQVQQDPPAGVDKSSNCRSRSYGNASEPVKCSRISQGRFVFRLRMTRAPPTSRSGTWPTHFRPLRWPLTTLLLPPATRHYSKPFLFVPSGVNPAELRTVKLSPVRLIRLFRTACRIVRSSGSVSVCQRTHTRAPLRGLSKARAFTSYRIGKDHPHDPDILSLRHDCPTLAAGSGKWFPLDGRSAIATGWFPSLSDRVRGPSHPPGGCSVTRPPTCRVTRPRAWFQASILNRFASSLAGG